MVEKLTAVKVKNAVYDQRFGGRPMRVADGRGLYLQVAAAGSKSWLFRYTLRGRSREMGIGSYGDGKDEVSLAKARILAEESRANLRQGRDPIEHRRAQRKIAAEADDQASRRTFRAVAESLIDSKAHGWRSAKHSAQWLATLQTHAFPLIGNRPVADIDTEDVLGVLRPIWARIPETASRVRQRVEAVLDAARLRGWRQGENPARWKGHLAGELPQPRKVQWVVHRPALAWPEISQFMAALAQVEGIGAKALCFLILTAARSGEVRGARWSEIDMKARV